MNTRQISLKTLRRMLMEDLEDETNPVETGTAVEDNITGSETPEGEISTPEPAVPETGDEPVEDVLNSLLGDEYNAWKQYKMMDIAAQGKSLARVQEIFKDAGKDELEDHFDNLCNWMQGAGMKPLNDPEELDSVCKCPYVKIDREQDTVSLVRVAVDAEKAAIRAYEEALNLDSVKAYPDLVYLLSEFLKDEREHLHMLQDVQGQIEGFESVQDKEVEVDDDDNEITEGDWSDLKKMGSQSAQMLAGPVTSIAVNGALKPSANSPKKETTNVSEGFFDGAIQSEIEKAMKNNGITPEMARQWQNGTPEQRNEIVKGFNKDGYSTEDDLYKYIGSRALVGGPENAKKHVDTVIGKLAATDTSTTPAMGDNIPTTAPVPSTSTQSASWTPMPAPEPPPGAFATPAK